MMRKRKYQNRSLLKAAAVSSLSMLALASCSALSSSTPVSATLQPVAPSSSLHASRNSQMHDPAATQSVWKLSWEDDFTGTGLPANWTFDTGGSGFGDKELQWNSDNNAQLSGNGELVISATKGGGMHTCWYGPCTYTAAKIQTTFGQTYGRFEARIKLPAGHGLWPAFWMIPASSGPGEIDIIEVNNQHPYLVTGYVHDSGVFSYRAKSVQDLPISSQYHTYGVDWTPSGITWTLDGKAYGHISAYRGWPFDQPFIMVLDLAVGGSWPGPPDASTVFPAKMLVSWVRVYKWVNNTNG
jgi:beta-glucanase (GH16 family)